MLCLSATIVVIIINYYSLALPLIDTTTTTHLFSKSLQITEDGSIGLSRNSRIVPFLVGMEAIMNPLKSLN